MKKRWKRGNFTLGDTANCEIHGDYFTWPKSTIWKSGINQYGVVAISITKRGGWTKKHGSYRHFGANHFQPKSCWDLESFSNKSSCISCVVLLQLDLSGRLTTFRLRLIAKNESVCTFSGEEMSMSSFRLSKDMKSDLVFLQFSRGSKSCRSASRGAFQHSKCLPFFHLL